VGSFGTGWRFGPASDGDNPFDFEAAGAPGPSGYVRSPRAPGLVAVRPSHPSLGTAVAHVRVGLSDRAVG